MWELGVLVLLTLRVRERDDDVRRGNSELRGRRARSLLLGRRCDHPLHRLRRARRRDEARLHRDRGTKLRPWMPRRRCRDVRRSELCILDLRAAGWRRRGLTWSSAAVAGDPPAEAITVGRLPPVRAAALVNGHRARSKDAAERDGEKDCSDDSHGHEYDLRSEKQSMHQCTGGGAIAERFEPPGY